MNQGIPSDASDAETTHSPVVDAFWRYAKAFQSLDPKAIRVHFHEPALMITPQGVRALDDADAVEQTYASIMASLPKGRYERTDFSPLQERRIGEDISFVTGSGTWVDKDGQNFMPFGMTYVFRRSGEDWRIVVAIIHKSEVA